MKKITVIAFCLLTMSACAELDLIDDVEFSEDIASVEQEIGSTVEAISNGGFETGSLSPWSTSSTFPASVASSSYYIHDGSYGGRLTKYDSSNWRYYPTWIKRTRYLDSCHFPDELSFWMRSPDRPVKVTVVYQDYSTQSWTFSTSSSWVRRTITSGFAGVGLRSIQVERTGSYSYNTTAVDTISFKYVTYYPFC